MRIAFVTNICSDYRVKLFELLVQHHDIDYYFFSGGEEWYWHKGQTHCEGNFKRVFPPGFRLGGTRVSAGLASQLFNGNYDIFIKCINGRFALPTTYAISRLQSKPFILWTGLWGRLRTPFHRLFFPAVQHVYRKSDAAVVYGHHVREYLIEEGADPERIFVAAQAVDNETYQHPQPESEIAAVRNELDLAPNDDVVLYVGRLEVGKGLRHLVEAFSLLRPISAKLVIVGKGQIGAEIAALATRIGVRDSVRFVGEVSSDEILRYYASASLLVLPSVATKTFKEPWGLVVNEAFNQALPVVVTATVGAAAGGLVRDGENGLVVPEGDPDALAQAIARLLENPDLRSRMGQKGREFVSRWSYERMAEGFLDAIDYVHHGHSRRMAERVA